MLVFVFGNEYLEQDSLALKVARKLKIPDVEFRETSNLSDILCCYGKDIWLMDVVEGLKEPCVLSDIDKIKAGRIVSLHDFDLAYFLKLLKKTGDVKRVRIIGIPQQGSEKEIVKKVRELIPHDT